MTNIYISTANMPRSEEQRKFLTEERAKGSAAAVCRSVEDARQLVFRYLRGE